MQSINKQSETGRPKADDGVGKAVYVEYCQGYVDHLEAYLQKKSNNQLSGTETETFSPVFRGLQVLNRDEEGRENCTACGLCAVACPAEAITMEAAERQPEKNIFTRRKIRGKIRNQHAALHFLRSL